MTDAAVTDRVISQGRALVRAIEAMTEIEPSGWFERALVRLLLAASGEKPTVLWGDEEDTIE